MRPDGAHLCSLTVRAKGAARLQLNAPVRGPLRVNRVVPSMLQARRLNPNNRTRRPAKAASPVGQLLPLEPQPFPSIPLLDHRVGGRKEGGRHGEPEHSSSLVVDNHFERSRLDHWQVCGFRALEDAASVDPDLTISFRQAGAIAHQSRRHRRNRAMALTATRYRRLRLVSVSQVRAMDRTAQLRGKYQSACKSHGSTYICLGTRQDARCCCSENCTGRAAVCTWSPLEPRPVMSRRRSWQKYRKPSGVISFVVPRPKSRGCHLVDFRQSSNCPAFGVVIMVGRCIY